MSQNTKKKTVYKLVLTGGPCGGKTTGQSRLSTFFENLGWKVFRVPETATILQKGGVVFRTLSAEEIFCFQKDLLITLLQIEQVYFHLADTCDKNVLIICDRGTMDGSAYVSPETWKRILQETNLHPVTLRDNRYNQVVHLTTAALGAEAFYSSENNVTRHESLDEARKVDSKTRNTWIGHPYVDVIDNACNTFEDKMLKLIQVVCDRANVQTFDRLKPNSRKRKFLVTSIDEKKFPHDTQDFDVEHFYLKPEKGIQQRLRKRGQNGVWNYMHTSRRTVSGKFVETRIRISRREYNSLYLHRDYSRFEIFKKRRCFMFGQQYFQLDIYCSPVPPNSPVPNLMILETYTVEETKWPAIPPFLKVEKEVTRMPEFSMYQMAKKTNLSEKSPTKPKQFFAGDDTEEKSINGPHPDILNGVHSVK